MSRLTFISLLSIIVLIIALVMGFKDLRVDEVADPQQAAVKEPDFYMINGVITQFDAAGKPDFRTKTSRLEHFPDGDYTLGDNPDVTLYNKKGIPWHITADKGRGTQNNENIELWGNVWLRRGTPEDVLDLKTRALTIFTTKDLVTTRDDVTLISNAGRIESTGMNAYIEQDRIEYLSNVRVTHDPIKPD